MSNEEMNKKMEFIVEHQVRTDESIKRLSEAQSQTVESLKALINTVERHIGGNGGSHSHA
jgi:hypothetical protein